jgi:hypothetical protein
MLTCSQSATQPKFGPEGQIPEQRYYRLWQNLLRPRKTLDLTLTTVRRLIIRKYNKPILMY